jgi:23S rRNA U2552 (ribose-2'-O)-methylase RlmE/FtsJ
MFNIKYVNKDDTSILEILNSNIIIKKELYYETVELKSKIDNVDFTKWKIIRSISTDYEIIGNNRIHNCENLKRYNIISRAYYKLWEILNKNEKRFDFFNKQHMKIACLAEAPGGFIQCMIHYRYRNYDEITAISLYENKNNIKWGLNPNKYNIIYGDKSKNHDGNLYNPEIIDFFIKSHKYKLDLVTADGGILLSDYKENYKSQYHLQLFLSELYVSIKLLKKDGVFILKIYEICSKSMLDFLILVNSLYEYVNIYKPKTSREMNNEKYIICKGLKKNTGKIQSEILNIIKFLWKNPKKLIQNILDDKMLKKYGYVLKVIKRVETNNLNTQKTKITNALLLNQKNKEELKEELRKKKPFHITNAYKWYKINNIHIN